MAKADGASSGKLVWTQLGDRVGSWLPLPAAAYTRAHGGNVPKKAAACLLLWWNLRRFSRRKSPKLGFQAKKNFEFIKLLLSPIIKKHTCLEPTTLSSPLRRLKTPSRRTKDLGDSRSLDNFFFFLVFLGPYPQYMEVPRLGVRLELQRPAYTTATRDPSHVCDLHHSSRQRQILNPPSKARDWTPVLMDAGPVHYHWATTGTPWVNFIHKALKDWDKKRALTLNTIKAVHVSLALSKQLATQSKPSVPNTGPPSERSMAFTSGQHFCLEDHSHVAWWAGSNFFAWLKKKTPMWQLPLPQPPASFRTDLNSIHADFKTLLKYTCMCPPFSIILLRQSIINQKVQLILPN